MKNNNAELGEKQYVI